MCEQIVPDRSGVGMKIVLMNVQREGIETIPVFIAKRADGAGLGEGFKEFGGCFVHCDLFEVCGLRLYVEPGEDCITQKANEVLLPMG